MAIYWLVKVYVAFVEVLLLHTTFYWALVESKRNTGGSFVEPTSLWDLRDGK